MNKLFVLLISILLLTGCVRNNDVNGEHSFIVTYCDTEYNVEYIRDLNYNHGGITVRLDENGNVIHCK